MLWESIELALDRLYRRVQEDPALRAEFAESREEFFVVAEAAQVPGAERRHLEWFLLERPSEKLGLPPAQAWAEVGEVSRSLGESIPGAFEVTALIDAEGFWVRDLFTSSEHPVVGASAALAVAVGDLLVGRLFPGGGVAYLLSPTLALYRNPKLLAAVRGDLAEMRRVRRGVLRIQQLELERLFHAAPPDMGEAPAPAEARGQARRGLQELGLRSPEVEDALARVRRAALRGQSEEVTEILNGLAFETEVDLAQARLVLAELWRYESLGSEVPEDASSQASAEARGALEAFDRGRAEGKDLELLFAELERTLGVPDDEEEAEEDAGVPDFPGVIGAMVDEFLWEVEREQGPELEESWSPLRALGRYAHDIGVFEELGRVQLLDFTARWLLDEGQLKDEGELTRLLAALSAFCRWSEEQHAHPLRQEFGMLLESLSTSLPRHFALRRTMTRPGRGLYRVEHLEREALVRSLEGVELRLALTSAQSALLQVGDWVRVSEIRGVASLGATYPPEFAELSARRPPRESGSP